MRRTGGHVFYSSHPGYINPRATNSSHRSASVNCEPSSSRTQESRLVTVAFPTAKEPTELSTASCKMGALLPQCGSLRERLSLDDR